MVQYYLVDADGKRVDKPYTVEYLHNGFRRGAFTTDTLLVTENGEKLRLGEISEIFPDGYRPNGVTSGR